MFRVYSGTSGGSVRDVSPTRVAVVGTLNMDVVVTVDVRPGVGETVLGSSVRERCGGKGANQAIARSTGVDVTYVGVEGDTSGRAFIEVDASGDNRIVVIPGANSLLSAGAVVTALDALDPHVVLTQLESPRAVTESVARWCTHHRRRFVLNPSPVAPLPEQVLAAADPLVVNEHEARAYAGIGTDIAGALLKYTASAVITLGARGVIVATPERTSSIAVIPAAEGVETTGAGDHFAGVLAIRLAEGEDLHNAATHAAHSATAFIADRHLG